MKKIISTDKAPAAIGPYSQAVEAGGFLYASGQLPLVPGTADFAGADITSQAKQALTNIKSLVEAAGYSMDMVVKCTVYMKDMNDFVPFNDVYKTFFTENCPARVAIEVARLPKDALIELDAIAYKG